TDGEGHFGFNKLPPNLYRVVIDEKAYQRIEEPIAIDPLSSSARLLTIYLVPRDAKKDDAPSAIKGGNTHLTDSAQYTHPIPKPAWREYEKGVRSDQNG